MSQHTHADFAPFAERMQREGLPQIVIDNFHYYYDVLASGSVGLIAESEIEPATQVPDIAAASAYAEAGRAALGRAAVLKLNGGLGTSMGLDQAKSLLVAREGMTFLDIIARQNLSFGTRYDCRVPLILMNSFQGEMERRPSVLFPGETSRPFPLPFQTRTDDPKAVPAVKLAAQEAQQRQLSTFGWGTYALPASLAALILAAAVWVLRKKKNRRRI